MKKKILSFREFTALTEGNADLWFLNGVEKKDWDKFPTWKAATWSATAVAAKENKSISELYEIEKKG